MPTIGEMPPDPKACTNPWASAPCTKKGCPVHDVLATEPVPEHESLLPAVSYLNGKVTALTRERDQLAEVVATLVQNPGAMAAERVRELEGELKVILDSPILGKLVAVANAYWDDGLDEARPSRNRGLEFDRKVCLISGRGGRSLLSIGDVLDAHELVRAAFKVVKKEAPGGKS